LDRLTISGGRYDFLNVLGDHERNFSGLRNCQNLRVSNDS
jgi:hypothetical protein